MFLITFMTVIFLNSCEPARILGVFPVPLVSHQVVFRRLMHELARNGHDVVVITTHPTFKRGEPSRNIKEIDVSNSISNTTWKTRNEINQRTMYYKNVFGTLNKVMEQQMKAVKELDLLNKAKDNFDLLIWECTGRMALVYSIIFDVPVIGVSSFGAYFDMYDMMGGSDHPIIYPQAFGQRVFNLSILETISEVYYHYALKNIYESLETSENEMLKTIFGIGIPALNDMKSRIQMLFLNHHTLWTLNRPVPRSVLYLGNLHEQPTSPLPKDLKTFLDSSTNGVVYVSFGSSYNVSLFSNNTLKTFTNVFSQLPYDILLKWHGYLPTKSNNIKVLKWLPQSDLLRHPKVKLFITQGGLQSTDEAISAGVPLIGIPLNSDQWYNTEFYVHYNIGVQLDIKTLTDEQFIYAIKTVIKHKSYRQNIIKLRKIMQDQPYSSLERAILWTEYILKNGIEAIHPLRAPAANMHWVEYYEIELVWFAFVFVITLSCIFVNLFKYLLSGLISRLHIK